MSRRIVTSHRSLLTKLLLLSLALLLAVGGIIATSLLAFQRTNALLSATIEERMAEVVKNAELGRAVSAIVAEANLILGTFLDHEDFLHSDAGQLVAKLRQHITQLEERETPLLHQDLQRFAQQLQNLFDHCSVIVQYVHATEELSATIEAHIDELDSLLAENIMLLAIEGRQEEAIILDQLIAMVPEYRYALAQLRLLLTASTRAHLGVAHTEEAYESQLLDVLWELRDNFSMLGNAGEEFSAIGEALHALIPQFQKQIQNLHHALKEYQNQLEEVQSTQQQISDAMSAMEAEMTRATGRIQTDIDATVQTSMTRIALLSTIVLVFLGIAVYSAVRMLRPISYLAEVARQLAAGKSVGTIQGARSQDEIGQLLAAMKQMTFTIQQVLQTMERVSLAVQRGQLDVRGHENDFSGNWRKLVAGFNQTIDAFVAPFHVTAAHISRIAEGDVPAEITDEYQGDFNELKNNLNRLIVSTHSVTHLAQDIANGKLNVNVTLRSEQDELMQALRRMVIYLQEVAEITERISRKDLQVEVRPRSAEDVLNQSLQQMVATLQNMMQEIDVSVQAMKAQNWLKTGQAELNDVMRGEQDVPELAKNIITYLASYLKADVGTVYLARNGGSGRELRLIASHAYLRRNETRNTVRLGEGIVGQVALEREHFLHTDIPADYLPIAQESGPIAPRQVLAVPLLYQEELKGVIEVGTVGEFTTPQLEFLTTVSENIAITIHTAQNQQLRPNK